MSPVTVDVLQVTHVFSHIRQTYVVDSALVKLEVDTDSGPTDRKWVGTGDFHTAAVSTAMRKVFLVQVTLVNVVIFCGCQQLDLF